jgi:hypothetical protein
MREAYRQHFCEVLPNSNPMEIKPPTAKRQCTQNLAPDVYIEKTSTDYYSEKDRVRLLDFNKLSSLTPQQQFKDPLSIADAKYHKNVYVRKQVRWYCQEVLEIVSPGNGEELYKYTEDLEVQYVNQKIQKTFNVFLNDLVSLYLCGLHWNDQRLAFVQLYGALSYNDLNTCLLHRFRFGGSPETLFWKHCARCLDEDRMIKRTKYNTGGISRS